MFFLVLVLLNALLAFMRMLMITQQKFRYFLRKEVRLPVFSYLYEAGEKILNAIRIVEVHFAYGACFLAIN